MFPDCSLLPCPHTFGRFHSPAFVGGATYFILPGGDTDDGDPAAAALLGGGTYFILPPPAPAGGDDEDAAAAPPPPLPPPLPPEPHFALPDCLEPCAVRRHEVGSAGGAGQHRVCERGRPVGGGLYIADSTRSVLINISKLGKLRGGSSSIIVVI